MDNSNEIKQGTINYYKKEAVDKEVLSSTGDSKGSFECYNENTLEAQESTFRVFGLENPCKELECLLVTNYQNETIPDQKPAIEQTLTNTKCYLEFVTKLNTTAKTNPDVFNTYAIILNGASTYIFENGYNISPYNSLLNTSGPIDENPQYQKRFGLNGTAQVVKIDLKMQEPFRLDMYEQKVIGKLDLSKCFDYIYQFNISNLNGNVTEIIMPKGRSDEGTGMTLKDVQISTFKPPISYGLALGIENAPYLTQIISPDYLDYTDLTELMDIDNCPELTELYTFVPGETLTIENCAKLPIIDMFAFTGSPDPATRKVILDNLPLIEEFNTNYALHGGKFLYDFVEDIENGVFITNCPLLKDIGYVTKTSSDRYIPSFVVNDTIWDYLSANVTNRAFDNLNDLVARPNVIDVKNNQMVSAAVDQILIDIDNAAWSSVAPPFGTSSIDISGNNAAPGAFGLTAVTSLQGKGWTVTTS